MAEGEGEMKKGPMVQGVGLSKGSPIDKAPVQGTYAKFNSKKETPYSGQARATAAGRMKR